MYRIVLLVLCYQAFSQPVANEPSTRHARELIECCPCPGTSDDQLARAVGGDDCPCRARGADSEGASSLFFPAAIRPDDSHQSPIAPKEDSKNLLEPEVALAASVLDTLREATEEEYRDALEREAARNAAEPDAVPEESARNVVIFVNPKASDNDDDFISEASNFQESRCIHPLESTPLDKVRSSAKPFNILPGSFKLPQLKHSELPHRNLLHFDSSNGASNAIGSIINPNGNLLKFRSQKHNIPFKSILDSQNDGLSLGRPNLNLNENKSIDRLKLRTDIVDDDLSSAPSNVQHQSETTTEETRQLFRNDKLPMNLRNFLKLRDVELIPKTVRNKFWTKPKLDISKFAIPALFKSNHNKNYDGKAKYLGNVEFSSAKKDSEQRGIDDANDNITDTKTIGNEDDFEINSMDKLNKPFNNMKADSTINENFSDDDENDAKKSEQINLDALTSPSQVKSSIIRTDNEKGSEAIVFPRIVSDCNSLDFKKSDINTQLKEVLDGSRENDSDSSDFENAIIAAEYISNFDDGTKAGDYLQDEDTNTDQDSATDSSNIILSTLAPLEKQERTINNHKESQDSEFIGRYEADSTEIPENSAKILDHRNKILQAKEIPSLSETLSSLRENVVKQIGSLKQPSTTSELYRPFSDNDNTNIDNEDEITIDDHINQMTANLDPANTAEIEATENVIDISMNDLQNMSNKLLDSNFNNQNNKEFYSTASNITDETNLKVFEINGKGDGEFSKTKLNSIDIERDASVEENACPTNLETKNANLSEENATKSATQYTNRKEMDTGASDTVINTAPGILDSLNPNLKLRSPFLNDNHPSNDPLKLLGKPIEDVLNLNTNLPTLDDLRERLANVFKTDDGSVENDSSSLETDFTNDCPLGTMATEASIRNSQKQPAWLNQLQDFNNDIIQKKPKISHPFDTLTKTRMLDLNSYRAHLPSPNSLDLKPLLIEPTLRNKVDKNKPSNHFGSDTSRTMLRKAKPSNTFANPLDNFPSLEELRNTLRSNTRNLINSPVYSDLLSENLRSHDIEDVAENIRKNTEKTFKGIQRKMKSSLRKPTLHNPLGDSLAKPQELLDDMNDKLKGIHYDLNDRLSSLRESFLDSSRLKTLENQPRKASNRNVMTNLRKSETKLPSPRLQTAASTTTNQEIDPHPHGLETRNFVHPNWDRSRKTQTAAESASASARIEKPDSPLSYLQRTSPPLRQNPIVAGSLRERTPTPSLNRDVTHSKDRKSPLFRTAMTPFNSQRQQSKVTISFGTTTSRPVLPSRPIIRVPNIPASQFEENNPSSTSLRNIDTLSRDIKAAKSAVTSGKFNPLRTSAPVPSPTDEDFEDTLNNFSNSRLASKDTKLKPSVLREMSKPSTVKHSNSNRFESANTFDDKIEHQASKSSVKTSHWPKISENAFLSKLREDVNMRKLVPNVPKPVKDVRTEQLDMLRSPTENTAIVTSIDEPLKENVSYRCRMVCTKEIK